MDGAFTLSFQYGGEYIVAVKSADAGLAVTKITVNGAAEPAPEPASEPAAGTTYTVVRGDCLWKLAKRFYGDARRWVDIYAANAFQIKNPNLIRIGMELIIPD